MMKTTYIPSNFLLYLREYFINQKKNHIFITKTDWNFCNRNLQSVAFNRKSWKLLSSFFSTLILPLFKIFFRVIFYLAVAFQRLWFPKAVMWYPHFRESKYKVFSGPYFPVFGLSTERYSVSLRIQSECEKIRTRKNSLFGHFSRSVSFFIKMMNLAKNPAGLQFKAYHQKRNIFSFRQTELI